MSWYFDVRYIHSNSSSSVTMYTNMFCGDSISCWVCLQIVKVLFLLLNLAKIPQPSPPRLNCFAEEPDPYCKTGLPPKFCEFRPTGRYPHPTFCDKFVLCNGRITDVQECKGLVYNPWIENCDWKHNYQCTNVNIGKI